MEKSDLQRRIRFVTEADKMKNILRQTLLADGSRRENDAEHSWHLALCALTFFDYAPPGTDLARVLKMALLHDMVEIYAGDTFAYDERANADKEARERRAADRLFGQLPAAQGAEFRALWEEFDAMQTPEAVYASAMDRFQPLLNNYLTAGHTWKLGDVASARVYGRIEPLRAAAPALWEYAAGLIEDSIEKGYLKR